MGYEDFEVLKYYMHMQRARVIVSAAEEDFTIAPIEAQACDTSQIGDGRGVRNVRGLGHPEPTGVFYPEQAFRLADRRRERDRNRANAYISADCREAWSDSQSKD